jgi:hypothetical protein
MTKKTDWDIKKLTLPLSELEELDSYEEGGDRQRILEIEVASDNTFTFGVIDTQGELAGGYWETFDLDAARRLRDFLNYAVPNAKVTGWPGAKLKRSEEL